jgi:hypothetical protein
VLTGRSSSGSGSGRGSKRSPCGSSAYGWSSSCRSRASDTSYNCTNRPSDRSAHSGATDSASNRPGFVDPQISPTVERTRIARNIDISISQSRGEVSSTRPKHVDASLVPVLLATFDEVRQLAASFALNR